MSEFEQNKEIRKLNIPDSSGLSVSQGGIRGLRFGCNSIHWGRGFYFLPVQGAAQGMQLVGRALPVKMHSQVDLNDFPDEKARVEARWNAEGGHPQKRMMRSVAISDPGSVLVFDCGGDMQPAYFGEMSCQLAYAHGCRGMLVAGNVRDTQYVLKMPDFPIYSFGTRPNAFGGWTILEVNVPVYMPGHITHYVRVAPGDFIFGDNDGVQLIPKDLVDEVLLRVEKTFEKENEERQQLAAGMPIDEVYRVFGVL
jgi:regulator of RNase E activity RraA